MAYRLVMFFVVRNQYHEANELLQIRPLHREYLRALGSAIRAAGPLETMPSSGLMIFEVDSRTQLDELLAKDPLAKAELIASQDIVEWNPLVGDLIKR